MPTRRNILTGLLATALIGPTSEVSVARQQRYQSSTSRYSRSLHADADWEIHHSIAVSKDGLATVTTELEGSEIPEHVKLRQSNTTNEKILNGSEALTAERNRYVWKTSETSQVKYSAELGHMKQSFVKPDSISFRGRELMLVKNWDGGRDAVPKTRQVTISPPDEWNVAAPGIERASNTYELAPSFWRHDMIKDFFAVGDFQVHRTDVDATELRLVAHPSADPPPMDELLAVLADVQPVIADYFGEHVVYPRLAIIGPLEINGGVGGGTGNDHSFTVTDKSAIETRHIYDLEIGHTVHLHELVHTFHRFSSPSRYQEGQATYIDKLALHESGHISEGEFRRLFQKRMDVGKEPKRAMPSEATHKQGAMIYAALDMDIRARTNGQEDIGSYIAGVNDQRADAGPPPEINRSESIQTLRQITGIDYTPFFEEYVDTADFPEPVLDKRLSITDPVTPWGFEFDISNLEVSKQSAFVNESITISAEIQNTGNHWGTDHLDLIANSEVLQYRNVAVDPGATKSIEIEHEFTEPDYYELFLNDDRVGSITVEPRVPELEIIDTQFSDRTVRPDEPVVISMTLKNNGTGGGEIPLTLEGGDEILAESRVELDVNETKSVSFEHVFQDPGDYELRLNNETLGTITVELQPTPTPESTPPTEAESMSSPADTGNSQSPTRSTSEDDSSMSTPGQPGFGVLATLAGLGSALSYFIFRNDRTE